MSHSKRKGAPPTRARADRRLGRRVPATDGYATSLSNLAQVSLDTDLVFAGDHAVHQLATMRGSVNTGYTATLNVTVDA